MTFAIKCIHNLPLHLSYVSTLPDITQKPKIYVVFLSIVWVVLKPIWHVNGSGKSRLCGCITLGVWSDIPLPLNMHAAVFATGQWLCWCSEEYGPKCQMLQLVNVAFQFLCNVRWGGKLCTHLIAKIISISHAKFHCNRLTFFIIEIGTLIFYIVLYCIVLQRYKIFKITQVSFLVHIVYI